MRTSPADNIPVCSWPMPGRGPGGLRLRLNPLPTFDLNMEPIYVARLVKQLDSVRAATMFIRVMGPSDQRYISKRSRLHQGARTSGMPRRSAT
jgi:hypothetical protein